VTHESQGTGFGAKFGLFVGGILIAAISAVCGIGGGIFAVPTLHYIFGVPLRGAVATGLCLVCASATTATVSEWLHPDGAIFPTLVLALVATALIGAQIGFWISKRLGTRALKAIFCFVMLGVGLRLIFMRPETSTILAEPDPQFVLTPAAHGFAALVGLFAGIVVPLLGLGGGLIVVPALLFGLPEVGFLGARAASLGMATITSVRSIWLFSKEGVIEWRLGIWFAVGATLGAASGVWLVHLHGAAEVGQVLLGIVLCIAATRFGLDVLRTRPQLESES